MKKEMLINVLQPEECRIAVLENGVLEELYVERTSHESYVGNIYKGRIVNIEPSIQAAFVDFGVGRNGFLHVSDVEPQYYRDKDESPAAGGSEPASGRKRMPRSRKRLLPELPDIPDIGEPDDASDDEDCPNELDLEENDTEVAPDDGENGGGDQRHESTAARGNDRFDDEVDDDVEVGDVGDATDVDDGGEPANGGAYRPPTMPSAEHRSSEKDDRRGFSEGLELEPLPLPAKGEKAASGGSASAPALPPLEFIDADESDDEGDGRRETHGRRGRKRRTGGRDGVNARPKPPIQEIFRRGDEVLVQVIKEGIGTKGPTLSTYISIPGRYLVLMPGLNRIGVSRKIIDDEHRRRLREVLSELNPPKGLGFIIRTAGIDRTKKELQRDLAYLSRLWKVVVRRIKKAKGPALIYEESDMIIRTIRDVFTSEIESIIVDQKEAFERAQEFLQIVMPRYANRIQLYAESEPLFYRYRIEEEIARIQRRQVPLPNGGSIVIDQTEALVAIDVNSGNFRADNNAEETAFRINLQAAREIARQLRLRDLGGVIINDFIDMREERHRREVERALRDAVRRDRARTKVLRMSQFGIIEMTRQRIRPSLKRSVYESCPHCGGTGHVKTCESMSIDVMRLLQLAAHRERVVKVDLRVAEAVGHYLLNKKRKEVSDLEQSGRMQVTIQGVPAAAPELLEIRCFDGNGSEIKLLPDGR